jgi:hypothetical protein
MIKVEVGGLRALREELAVMGQNVTKEVRVAAWKTQKKGRMEIARNISSVIKRPAKFFKKASYSKMLPDGFFIAIRGEFRIALKHFSPKHIKPGISVNVNRGTVYIDNGRKKRTGGKQVIAGGFMGPKPGIPTAKFRGVPMQRKGSGRLPIQAIPAVHLTSTLQNIDWFTPKMADVLKVEFVKQIRERIRFLKVKMAGKLRNQK